MVQGKWLASGVLAGALVCVTLVLFWTAGKKGEPAPLPRSADDPRLSFATPYKNVRPEVQYVDDDLCAGCHVTQAESYRKHPMGRSLAPVATVAAGQRYDKASQNPFTFLGAEFLVDRQGERLFHKETRRNAQGEPFAATAEEVHYVIGSGVHNFSYLIDHDGCLTESPITWFTQKQRWDLSPGFGDRRDFFERPIPPECLFCHSNRVEPVPDTVNLYRRPIFHGYAIGCQRCHGPGELHIRLREQGGDVHGPDDTIVNPARLPPELREAVCQQCHLEGGAHSRPGPAIL
jgi:hypothetical protein